MPTSPATEPGAPHGDAPAGTSDADARPGPDAPAAAGAPGGTDAPAASEANEANEANALRRELAATEDRYRRAVADLDNYRKRMAAEGDRRAEEVRVRQMTEWLDAVDSVEIALRHTPDDPGLEAVRAQMDSILARNDVSRTHPVGSLFDPTHQEAIAVQVTDAVPDRTVLEVTRSGYEFTDGRVLRTAQVVVSKRPPDGP